VSDAFLTDPALVGCGVAHGFGVRGAEAPAGSVRPRQVHGRVVAHVGNAGAEPADADAIVSLARAVAVVTADCVPVLLAVRSGAAVAAVHAGWRGLASGVVGAGVEALREAAAGELAAALGPHIGACCYEVDAPVLDALRPRFAEDLDAALVPTRPGHQRLDLRRLVRSDLERAGVAARHIGTAQAACTQCDPRRFHSYRRDGPASGRLVHWIRPETGGDGAPP
jgi:YfiH family protein